MSRHEMRSNWLTKGSSELVHVVQQRTLNIEGLLSRLGNGANVALPYNPPSPNPASSTDREAGFILRDRA